MAAVAVTPWRDSQVCTWAAGEAGMLRPVRRRFKDRGVEHSYTDVAGY
ncbi:SIP domain-containing protein [Streptomyces sp. NPDC060035]